MKLSPKCNMMTVLLQDNKPKALDFLVGPRHKECFF